MPLRTIRIAGFTTTRARTSETATSKEKYAHDRRRPCERVRQIVHGVPKTHRRCPSDYQLEN